MSKIHVAVYSFPFDGRYGGVSRPLIRSRPIAPIAMPRCPLRPRSSEALRGKRSDRTLLESLLALLPVTRNYGFELRGQYGGLEVCQRGDRDRRTRGTRRCCQRCCQRCCINVTLGIPCGGFHGHVTIYSILVILCYFSYIFLYTLDLVICRGLCSRRLLCSHCSDLPVKLGGLL